jgi:hypothetical protein
MKRGVALRFASKREGAGIAVQYARAGPCSSPSAEDFLE